MPYNRLIHTLISSNYFILINVGIELKHIPAIVTEKQEHTLDETPVNYRAFTILKEIYETAYLTEKKHGLLQRKTFHSYWKQHCLSTLAVISRASWLKGKSGGQTC